MSEYDDKLLIKKDSLTKNIGKEQVNVLLEKQRQLIIDAIIDALDKLVLKVEQPKFEVVIPEEQKVQIVNEKLYVQIANPKEIQKIEGEVVVDLDEVYRLLKSLLTAVNKNKPIDIQTIKGKIEALVKFPDIQKIDGGVYVTNLPIGEGAGVSKDKANPTKYMTVRLSNGKQFYEVMSQSISSNGEMTMQLKQMVALLTDISIGGTPLVGQKRVASTGVAIKLITGTTRVKNGVIIQALKANTAVVYVGGSGVTSSDGFELQAGQATSITISDISLMYVTGTSGDGVCFIGAA